MDAIPTKGPIITHCLQIALLALAILFPSPLFGQADLTRDFPNLSGIYKVDEKRSDFIIAVDRSGSMKPYWTEIRRQLTDFVSVLPDGDYVSIIGFGTKARHLLIPRTLSREAKEGLKKEVGLLADPREQYTDLFEGALQILEEVNRPGSNPVCFVFVFTDFLDEPSPQRNASGRARLLKGLREKYGNYVHNTGKIVSVYAFQLPLSGKAGEDFDDFSNIFDNTVQRIFVQGQVLQDWFSRIRASIQKSKLRLMVGSDMGRPLRLETVGVPGTSFSKSLSVRLSNGSKLPLTVNSVTLDTGGAQTLFSGPVTETIQPGKTGMVTLPFNESLQKAVRALVPGTVTVSVRAARASVSLPYGSELAKLDIKPPMEVSFSYGAPIILQTGPRYWELTIALAILVAILFYSWAKWWKPQLVFGGIPFEITVSSDGKPLQLREQFISRKSSRISFGNELVAEPSNILPFTVSFLARKPGFLRGRPLRGTYLSCRSDEKFEIERIVKGEFEWTDVAYFNSPLSLRAPIHLRCEYNVGGSAHSLNIEVSMTSRKNIV